MRDKLPLDHGWRYALEYYTIRFLGYLLFMTLAAMVALIVGVVLILVSQ